MSAKPHWPTVPFGDVVRQVKDRVDPQTFGLTRYIAGEHMDTDDLRLRHWGDIGDNYLGPAFHMRFKPGQVLYGSRRTYLRKVAVADFEGICANTTFVLEPKDPEILLPELLPFIMQTESFHEHSIKQSKGSVNPYINFSDLAWYQFPLPPPAEQRPLAEALWAIESVTTEYQSLESESFRLRRAIQENLLLGSEYSGSKNMRIDELVLVNPHDKALPNDAPFVPMEAVDEWDRRIRRTEIKGTRGGVRAQAGDILLARITPCLENGKTAQVPELIERCGGSTEFIVLRAKDGVSSDFVYWMATAPSVRHRAIGLMHGSTGRQRLAAQDFASLNISIAPQEIVRQAIDLLNQIEKSQDVFLARIKESQSLKRRTLEDAFYRGGQ